MFWWWPMHTSVSRQLMQIFTQCGNVNRLPLSKEKNSNWLAQVLTRSTFLKMPSKTRSSIFWSQSMKINSILSKSRSILLIQSHNPFKKTHFYYKIDEYTIYSRTEWSFQFYLYTFMSKLPCLLFIREAIVCICVSQREIQ